MIKFSTPINLALLAAVAITIVTGFVLVPPGASLPVHWNLAGEPDSFMPRELALLMPAFILGLLWLTFLMIGRVMRPKDREAAAHMLSVTLTAMTALFFAIAVALVAIGIGLPVNMVQVIAVAIGVLLLTLGNAMPKSRPNSFAGLRIPTTINSATNWQATHRLTGILTLIAGLVLLVAAFLLPPPALIWVVLGCAIAPFVVGTIYSIALARRPT